MVHYLVGTFVDTDYNRPLNSRKELDVSGVSNLRSCSYSYIITVDEIACGMWSEMVIVCGVMANEGLGRGEWTKPVITSCARIYIMAVAQHKLGSLCPQSAGSADITDVKII